jgi:hypothetical protein
MLNLILNRRHFILAFFILFIASVNTVTAQSTGFTYQGRLNDNNLSANGNYDFEFKLFTALTGGTQDGTSRQVLNVAVTNGTFTVLIDFGAGVFPGADRFLEIGVKPAGGSGFTTLTPRQQVTLTPYAIKSASATSADFAINATNATNATTATTAITATTANNALQLGGVAANQYVQTNDPRMTDARNPLPNSTNYIQNRTTQQTSTNFNISGNGTVGGTVSANQFNLSGDRILFNTGTNNIFAGVGAGTANTGSNNAFFGRNSGQANTTGSNNAFFGSYSGALSTTSANSFFGSGAGQSNTTGGSNTFFGYLSGNTNTTGSNLTLIGNNADVGTNNLTNATALGYRAFVESSNALVLGSVNGKNNTTADTFVGIGTTTPSAFLDIVRENPTPIPGTPNLRLTQFGENTLVAGFSGRRSRGTRSVPTAVTSSDSLLLIEADGYNGNGFTTQGRASIHFIASEDWTTTGNGTAIRFLTTTSGTTTESVRMQIDNTGNVGIGTTSPVQKLDVNGNIRIGTGTTGCVEDRDGTVIAGTCSSDLRFKRNITPFGNILSNFSKLRPVNFFWRADEFADKHFGTNQSFGLIAQEVEQAFPELVSTDEQGYKVVNYSKLPLLTIQAVKELKSENDTLKQQLQQQQSQIDELKKALSSIQPNKTVRKQTVRRKR